MALIQLVRHGQAAAGFGSHADPGLNEVGHQQAESVAQMLSEQHDIKRPKLYSSPLARAQETAVPLAKLWQAPVSIETRVAEIPSPTQDLAARADWLSQAMMGHWADLDKSSQAWQQTLLRCLVDMQDDCIIFSHYVAINAAVGGAQGDPRMRVFAPDNCSVTTLDNAGGKLQVIAKGQVADTFVN